MSEDAPLEASFPKELLPTFLFALHIVKSLSQAGKKVLYLRIWLFLTF